MLCLGGLAFLIFASYEVARSPLKALLTVRYGADALAVCMAWRGDFSHFNGDVLRESCCAYFSQATVCSCCADQSGRSRWFSPSSKPVGARGRVLSLIWKDVYIVLLGEMFWTMANRLFELKRAKYVFGFFCALGSLGAFAGSWATKTYAHSWGTSQLPWLVLPILLVSIPVVFGLPQMGPKVVREKAPLTEGLKLVFGHRYLLHILGMIACIQLAVNLMDYQLTHMIQQEHPGQDEQTAVFGHIYSQISQLALVFQLGCGLIIGLYGVPGTLRRVPMVLLCCLGAFALLPSLVFDLCRFRPRQIFGLLTLPGG